MRKVELSVIKPWIANKVKELLGFEDDIVVEYVNGLLEDDAEPVSSHNTQTQISRPGLDTHTLSLDPAC